jgi:PTH1 family peptidyl-tRNA hydrolase
MKLIAGLGNPGFLYARNRHNIGFMCISHLAKMQGIRFDRSQGHARIGIGNIAGNRVVLARPQTYMNSSGESVGQLVKRFNINLSDLIVIHDDLDLPLGKIRIRQGGSSGGHKGIDSIIAHLYNHEFYRVRVGIGRPDIAEGSAEDKEAAIIAYVLSDFTDEEIKIITGVIPEVSEAILCLLREGLTAAMNKYN